MTKSYKTEKNGEEKNSELKKDSKIEGKLYIWEKH